MVEKDVVVVVEEEEEGCAGLCIRVVVAVHGAGLVAGSSSNPAFFCEKKFPPNTLALSSTNLLAPVNPDRAHGMSVPSSQLLTA